MNWITQHPVASIMIALVVITLLVWACRKGAGGAILDCIGDIID